MERASERDAYLPSCACVCVTCGVRDAVCACGWGWKGLVRRVSSISGRVGQTLCRTDMSDCVLFTP